MPKPAGMSRNKWKRLKVQIRLGNQPDPEVKPTAVSTDEPQAIDGTNKSIDTSPPDDVLVGIGAVVEDDDVKGITPSALMKKCSTCGKEYGNAKYDAETCRDCFNGSNWEPKVVDE